MFDRVKRMTPFLLGLLMACGGDPDAVSDANPDGEAAPTTLTAGPGVDVDGKIVRIGLLNDESGPAAAIGKPFAIGKRLLAAQINAGGSGLLPDGWTVELVERDHAYNPQNSVQAYKEIKDQVLFFGHTFGTPNTMPLRPLLEADGIIAFPASLSSEMAKHAHTPPAGPSYEVEARRAMDWAVSQAAEGATLKAGIVSQQDDYGADGLNGWRAAAKQHGVEIVSEQTVSPGQKDFTAVVAALKDAGADTVLLAILPSASGPILGTAAQLGYGPTWIGNTPTWVDAFFLPDVIPSVVFGKFNLVTGMPFWGEEVEGMAAFTAAWDAHGAELGNKDSYILMSYLQGLTQIEVTRRAIESNDVTRAGFQEALGTIDGFTSGGLSQPITLNAVPYVAGTRTRILRPDFEAKSWTVVADWAEPTQAGAVDAPKEAAAK